MSSEQSGVWRDDPSKSAEIGAKLDIQFMHHFPMMEKGAGILEKNWTHFGTALLTISFYDGEHLRTDGSAVLIGPGLALSARHVFDPVMEELKAGNVSPMVASVTEDGVVLWRLHQIVFGQTDVAILRLDLASDFPPHGLRCALLTTRTPAVGEPIMIAGARSEEPVALEAPKGMAIIIGVGEVGSVYGNGRDRVMLPNACIEVQCLAVGGMSGGPAFDKNGNLVGILTSSFEADEGPAFISNWWPTAGDIVETIWPNGIAPVPLPLLDLAKHRAVMIDRPDALRLTKESDGNTTVEYRPWT